MSLLKKLFSPITAVFGWLTPDIPKPEDPGAELTKAATDAPIPKIYGKVKKHSGTIIFKATNDFADDDIENDLLHIVIVWAEAVQSIDKVYVDDVDIESNSDLFVADGNRYAYARNFPNGMDGYNYSLLTDAGWRTTDKCLGKACTYIRLQYGANGENLLRSEPNFTADLTGTATSNNATVLQDYLTADKYGKDLPTSFIDTAAFAAAVATCKTQVEKVKDGGDMRDLFTINAAIDTGQSVFDNVNQILKSMRALMPISNGKLKPIVEKDDPVVTVPILENDIISLGEIRNSSKRNRYNRVVVTYIDEDAEGTKQEAVYPPKDSQIETDLLAEDNGVLLETSVKIETCNNFYEALAFAKTYLEISREQLNTSVTLDLWATIYEVGDIVEVTHSVPGFVAKPFRITSITETDYEVELELREHQPAIYDYENTGLKPTYPDTSNALTRPATPANVTKLDVYNNLKQIDITWTGTTTRYSYVVKTAANEFIESGTVARKKVELRNLAQDNYNIKIYAINAIGMVSSVPASFDFAIDQEQNFFTWVVYAESDTGLNRSETDDTDKTHIGLSPGQVISQASATSAAILAANYAYIPKPSGATATDGKSFATVSFFQRAASIPTKPADNSASFNFGTGAIVPPAGWSTTIPSGSNPLYVTTSTFGVTGASGTDTTSTFSDVAKLAQDGADAPPTKSYRTILIRRRSASALNTPTGGSYNFTNNALTPPTGWQEGTPSGTDPVYESIGIASVDGSTGVDSVITWSAPEILVQNGGDGNNAFTLVNTANTTITPTTVTKAGGVYNAWNAGAYSLEAYETCSMSVRAGDSNLTTMVGISNDDGTSANYTTIDYQIYFNVNNLRVYEGAALRGTFGTFTVNDVLSIVNDGESVKYLKNGSVFYTSTIAPSGAYRFDCSLYGAGDSIKDISFTPAGAKGADGQSVTLIGSSTDANGNTIINFNTGDPITIGRGTDATPRGVKVMYADNADGLNASFADGGRAFVRYDEWSGTEPASPLVGTGLYVKFRGADGQPATNSGVIPVYADNESGTGRSLVRGSKTFVNFYEWTGTKPTSAPTGTIGLFVKIVGVDGVSVTVTDNGNGTKTITGANGSIVVSDGNDGDAAPIPILTNNGNGTYTIDNQNGQTLTFADGDTPQLNVDYFVAGGNYVSNIFRNATTRPTTPTTGSFNGTTETFPSGWSDNPADYTPPSKRWVSTRQYERNASTGVWTASGAWSTPALQGESGADGQNATVSRSGNIVTITAANGSVQVFDGNDGDDAPIPTFTTNGDGSVTINPNTGAASVTIPAGEDGATPVFGTDYFNGADGSFISYVYANGTTRPTKPTGGTFNGTTEVLPSGVTDTPNFVQGQITWRSQKRYAATLNPTTGAISWSNSALWSEFTEHVIEGPQGDVGPPGADAPTVNSVTDTTATRVQDSVAAQTVFTIVVPAGTWDLTAEFSGSVSASDNVFLAPGEPDTIPRSTRIRCYLTRDGVIVSGSDRYDPSSSTFEANQSYDFNWSIPNQSGGAIFRLIADIDVSGLWDNISFGGTGFLRAIET